MNACEDGCEPLGEAPEVTLPARGSRVYIAGPCSGYPQFNYPAFAYVATVLRSRGVDARSPHELDGSSTNRTWQWYMREALKMLLDCDEVVLLPGWENSRGACIERSIAAALEMPIREWEGSTGGGCDAGL